MEEGNLEEVWFKKSGDAFQKQKLDCLWINLDFYEYLQEADPGHLPWDIAAGKVSQTEVITEAEKFLETVANLAAYDRANMKKCVSFLGEKFPHAIVSLSDYSMDVSNLTKEEIAECLNQKDLTFYFCEEA